MIQIEKYEVLLVARAPEVKAFIIRDRATKVLELRVHFVSGRKIAVTPPTRVFSEVVKEVREMFDLLGVEPELFYLPEGLDEPGFCAWMKQHDLLVERPIGRVN